MPDQIKTAITLLIVGIITVFAILTLIVILGGLLIRLVNRYYPQPPQLTAVKSSQGEIAPDKIAAIIAAVESTTGGKGQVEHISKRKNQNNK